MPRPIGVFDSGIGGLAMAEAIKRELPGREVILVSDAEHLPYGNKPPGQLLEYVLPKLQQLVDGGCEVIVIACNTVTTTLITELREQIPVPLVGMEPMVRPAAALTKTGKIIICATPTTLASRRYHWLKDTYAQGIEVIEPDCSDWAAMIEANRVERHKIESRITDGLGQGADVIVLGCTHYHWIEELIKDIAGNRARVLQPEEPVTTQLKKVLSLQP